LSNKEQYCIAELDRTAIFTVNLHGLLLKMCIKHLIDNVASQSDHLRYKATAYWVIAP
jgi:hypothetical protein